MFTGPLHSNVAVSPRREMTLPRIRTVWLVNDSRYGADTRGVAVAIIIAILKATTHCWGPDITVSRTRTRTISVCVDLRDWAIGRSAFEGVSGRREITWEGRHFALGGSTGLCRSYPLHPTPLSISRIVPWSYCPPHEI